MENVPLNYASSRERERVKAAKDVDENSFIMSPSLRGLVVKGRSPSLIRVSHVQPFFFSPEIGKARARYSSKRLGKLQLGDASPSPATHVQSLCSHW